MKIMIVDDNPNDMQMLREFLIPKGYQVIEAISGEEALEKIRFMKPDVVVLDWVLPGKQGVDVCKEIKTFHPDVPVLMLSVNKDSEYKVKAFQFGCDDYLAKPCELEELEIRLKNLCRRHHPESKSDKVFQLGNIHVDFSAHRVTKRGNSIDLTVKEYCLLEFLIKNINKVVTRTMILETVWGTDTETFTNIVDVYVNYLRRKIDDSGEESLIKTIRGIGYMVEVPTEKSQVA